MSVDDVIRGAPTEGTVYFLLTAYIEAVWRPDGGSAVHPAVGRLPLSGLEDIEARLDLLTAEAQRIGRPPTDDAANPPAS